MVQDNSAVRLAAVLREQVARSAVGDRLPSARQLARDHRVSPHTIGEALALLRAEGTVVSRPGAGTFVAAGRAGAGRPGDHAWQAVVLGDRTVDTRGLSPLADPPETEGVISLATGYLHPSLAPGTALTAALRRAGRRPGIWDRPPSSGLRQLRAWFATLAGGGAGPDDVVVTAGGQPAIAMVLRALLPPGAPLLMEAPTYPGAIAAARAVGLRTVPVPADGAGMIPELAARALEQTGAQALFLQPRHANPTGASLRRDRRAAILALAAAADAFVVEDDCSRWLGHGARPGASLFADDRDGHVVHLTSLTKATSPSLRVGAVVARGPLTERLRALHAISEGFVPAVTQEIALDLVTHPSWDRHLRELGRALAGRAGAMVGALARYLPGLSVAAPTGGVHLWASLPDGVDEDATVVAARRHGVVLLAGRPFAPAEPDGGHLRLTFSAASGEADIEAGIRRLAAAVPPLAATPEH